MKQDLILVAPFGDRKDADRVRPLPKGPNLRASIMGQNRETVCSGSQP
jgi:hypothetical protein